MPDDVTPDWARRFNFSAHSPGGINRPNCKEIFEKVIARPRKVFTPPNVAMRGGTEAETYVRQVLLEDADAGEAYRHAVSKIQEHTPQDFNPDDAAKRDIILNGLYESDITEQEDTVFALTLQHLLEGTREAVKGENKVEDGPWVSAMLEGVELPFIGQLDFMTRGVVELKTQWPYVKPNAKRGFQVNSLPAKPKADHINQVALYWKWMRKQSDNVPVTLVYANCKAFRVFSSVDCPELSEARLTQALESMRLVARTRETLMRKADDVSDLLSMIAPDFSHWMWRSESPAYKQLAEQVWSE